MANPLIRSGMLIVGGIFLWCFFGAPLGVYAASGGEAEQVWKFDFRDTFYDVAYITKEKAVIVGALGRVLISHPKYKYLWSVRNSGTKELLTSLSFVDEKNGWACGYSGVIIHTADGGESWQTQRPAVRGKQPLFRIQFVSPSVGYACGAYDTFLKTTDGGTIWNEFPTKTDTTLNDLYFADELNGFLVGEFGRIFKTVDGGVTWQLISVSGYEGSFFGITVLAPDRMLVYGITGKLFRTDDAGATWREIKLDLKTSLFRAAVNGALVAIVGSQGIIMLSRDGGITFTKRTDPDLVALAGICAHPAGGFLCVGEQGKIYRFKAMDK